MILWENTHVGFPYMAIGRILALCAVMSYSAMSLQYSGSVLVVHKMIISRIVYMDVVLCLYILSYKAML